MIKILFFIPNTTVGGAEKVVLNVITEISKKHICYLAYIDSDTPGERLSFPDGIVTIPLKSKRTRYALLELSKIIIKVKPDIVFSSWSRTNLLLVSLKIIFFDSFKVVIREPNLPSFSLRLLGNEKVYSWLYKKLYPKSDLIICQSQEMRLELINYFLVPETKVTVIHNMLSVHDVFNKSLTQDFLLDIKSTDIISCGRLVLQKGYDLLIASFHKIAFKYPDTRLIIFGEGPKRNELENHIIKLGLVNRILLPGQTSNPYFYMKQAHTYVSSSRWEGLPNTVLEAMACGANILASDCPGATSEIIDHGVNGWLVTANSIESLADGIDKCLSGQWRLSAESVKRSAVRFDAKNIMPEYEQAVISVL